MVVSGHRETTVPKVIANCFAEIQNWADVDDCGRLCNPDPFSEKQVNGSRYSSA